MAMMKESKAVCVECGNDYAKGYCPHATLTEMKDPNGGSRYRDPKFIDKIAKENFKPREIMPVNRFTEDMPVKGQSDFPELRKQINDWITNFYGPSSCAGCGKLDVVRSEMNTWRPVTSWDTGGEEIKWYRPHHCTHLSLFKGLAGKVLTVIDASLITNPKQHKAVVDLLRKAFSETISHARELEGDNNGESTGEGLA